MPGHPCQDKIQTSERGSQGSRGPSFHVPPWFHLLSLVTPTGPGVTVCVLRESQDLFSPPLPSCLLWPQVHLCTTRLSLLTPLTPCPLCLGNYYNSRFSEWKLPTHNICMCVCVCVYVCVLPINKITTRWRQTTLCFHHEEDYYLDY